MYLYCPKKSNQPRMHVDVCAEKCDDKCSAWVEAYEITQFDKSLEENAELQPAT